MKKAELKDLYFNIYMTYINSHTTLEDIGLKYNISKQRVWQIVRYSTLGDGNYYKGLKSYNTAHKKMKEVFRDQGSWAVNQAMRNWLESEGVRLIKTKHG